MYVCVCVCVCVTEILKRKQMVFATESLREGDRQTVCLNQILALLIIYIFIST